MEWEPLLLSIRVAAMGTVVAGVIGVAVGAWLSGRRFFGRDLIDAVFSLPMVMPPTVLGYYLLVVLGRRSPVGQMYEMLTGASIVFTATGAVVAATVGALPLVAKTARASFEAVDPRLVDAARTLGACPWRAFFTVKLPLAWKGVGAGLMLGYARALGDFGVTLMIAGNIPGETRTASLAIYDAVQAGRQGEAAGMIGVMSALAIGTLWVVNKVSGAGHAAGR